MFAIIKMGGKQYKVEEDQVIEVEKLSGNVGDTVNIEEVLLLSDGEDVLIGKNIPGSVKINAEIVEHTRGPKMYVFKYKRRKGYRHKIGHKQHYTMLKIKEITK